VSTEHLRDAIEHGEITDVTRDRVLNELRSRFRPEFLNRMDDIVLFKALGRSELDQIVGLMIGDVANRLVDRRITLDVSAQARELLVERGYDSAYGARPLRRYIQHELETRIARALIGGDVPDGSRELVAVVDLDEFTVRFEAASEVTQPSEATPVG